MRPANTLGAGPRPGQRPNIVFIMSDDHAAHAISAYGSAVTDTPQIDRIAAAGARMDSMFCANALCAPSRASILTGSHSHVNKVRTLGEHFDNTQDTFVRSLHNAGYATALFGKWHLGEGPAHQPRDFDAWRVMPGQGEYLDPPMIDADGTRTRTGHMTDLITRDSLDWLRSVPAGRPFCLLVHHKAPHRPWTPQPRFAEQFADRDVPEPVTLRDDYSNRASAAAQAHMRISRDLKDSDLKQPVPDGLDADAELQWKYQRYMQDYLACVAGVDESVGLILDHLDQAGLAEDTIVIYTSDQGFFLGDHGWYDKRFMYEESLRMPFLVRYPREIPIGFVTDMLASNVDIAQTLCDYAGVAPPIGCQGRSLRQVLAGSHPGGWRTAVYYRYWEHDDAFHHVQSHYGIRTDRYKLIYYYADGFGLPGTGDSRPEPEWELFDLARDPHELRNVYHDHGYASIRAVLRERLDREQRAAGDIPCHVA